MSTIPSPLVADWIAKELKWKYIVKDITKALTIPANDEKNIGDYKFPEGILLSGLFRFDRPFGAVRIEAYPEWPDLIDIPTLWTDGVIAPNVWGWISRYNPTPYTGNPGVYTITIPEGQVWQNIFKIYVKNMSPTVSIKCTRYRYVLAVLEQPRTMTSTETFEREREN